MIFSRFFTPKPHLHFIGGQWYVRSGSDVSAHLHWLALDWAIAHSVP